MLLEDELHISVWLQLTYPTDVELVEFSMLPVSPVVPLFTPVPRTPGVNLGIDFTVQLLDERGQLLYDRPLRVISQRTRFVEIVDLQLFAVVPNDPRIKQASVGILLMDQGRVTGEPPITALPLVPVIVTVESVHTVGP